MRVIVGNFTVYAWRRSYRPDEMKYVQLERFIPFTQGVSPVQLLNVMLVTSSLTFISNPSRMQASSVNALSWWKVKLKLLLFT